jgi:RsmE family RNA methyltransferase
MNLLLLHPEQRLEGDLWRLTPRQSEHVRGVLKLAEGDHCRVGLLDQGTGLGRIESLKNNEIVIFFKVTSDPMAPLPLNLLLALPRPKMLKRLLVDAVSLGIKRIVLINSWKVDKSYWRTPTLKAGLLREKMVLGLEQAGDPVLPELRLAPRFRPFVEDDLEGWAGPGERLLAHPGDYPELPRGLAGPATLAIGPEGGWTPFEIERLEAHGFRCHRFGSRVLRVETALPALVGGLMRLP